MVRTEHEKNRNQKAQPRRLSVLFLARFGSRFTAAKKQTAGASKRPGQTTRPSERAAAE